MTMIGDNLQAVRQRMAQACTVAGRPADSVTLLAVSKTYGPQAIAQAVDAGQRAFGENYIQEALDKMAALAHLPVEWHCIGPIQSNKTRWVAEHFDWAHTVDRLKIAQRLNDQRPTGLPALQVCIQVNVDGGATKSGVPPDAVPALAHAVAALPRLRLRGIMCIPEPTDDAQSAGAVFAKACAILDALRATGLPVDTASMGMSGDLEAAIASGSTMVRVGSSIFGARAKRPTPSRL
ncbi:MAG: YggS family pyridoxal phosphate-dependent enzyme [Rhodoferax sp.]|nr:YggS family pyridoxal phosphate-dependent enzyme [Rhodoferax sp.]